MQADNLRILQREMEKTNAKAEEGADLSGVEQ